MQLSEQELVRRESLQKIIDLGINPFPAEKYEVDFTTTEFVTADFKNNLKKAFVNVKGIGEVGAAKMAEVITQNKFRANQILQNP